MKHLKEIKTYHSIAEFNHDFFNDTSKKSIKQIEKDETEDSYGKILAVELLDELKKKIK